MRRALIPVIVALAFGSVASARAGDWRFHWAKDQVLTYRVEHVSVSLEEKPLVLPSAVSVTELTCSTR